MMGHYLCSGMAFRGVVVPNVLLQHTQVWLLECVEVISRTEQVLQEPN